MNSQKLSLLFKYFLLLVSLASCAHNEDENDEKLVNQNIFFDNLDFKAVVTYDDKNYMAKIKVDKPLMIYVYEPSCLYCQETIPIYIEFSDFLKKIKLILQWQELLPKKILNFLKIIKLKILQLYFL
jgi:thiol-disulfide isomerase/thioredoxin